MGSGDRHTCISRCIVVSELNLRQCSLYADSYERLVEIEGSVRVERDTCRDWSPGQFHIGCFRRNAPVQLCLEFWGWTIIERQGPVSHLFFSRQLYGNCQGFRFSRRQGILYDQYRCSLQSPEHSFHGGASYELGQRVHANKSRRLACLCCGRNVRLGRSHPARAEKPATKPNCNCIRARTSWIRKQPFARITGPQGVGIS